MILISNFKVVLNMFYSRSQCDEQYEKYFLLDEWSNLSSHDLSLKDYLFLNICFRLFKEPFTDSSLV